MSELKDKAIKCPFCNGDGFTSEHDDMSFDRTTGEHDCHGCPIQVQCHHCEAEGKLVKPSDAEEEIKKAKKQSVTNGKFICKQRNEISSLKRDLEASEKERQRLEKEKEEMKEKILSRK